MAISITVAEVKDKLLIPSATTTYDTPIDSLIDLMQPALETELVSGVVRFEMMTGGG